MTKPAREQEFLRTLSIAMDRSMSGSAQPALKASPVTDAAPVVATSSDPAVMEAHKDGDHRSPNADTIDVLIAEDNDVNQMFIKYIMEDMGVSFKIVENGKLAVDKWKLLSPKIVLMDISMPELNGHEATQAIRTLEAKLGRPRTLIVAVTAHALSGDRQVCLDSGMDDYLSKPIAISRITGILEKWTDINETIDIKQYK